MQLSCIHEQKNIGWLYPFIFDRRFVNIRLTRWPIDPLRPRSPWTYHELWTPLVNLSRRKSPCLVSNGLKRQLAKGGLLQANTFEHLWIAAMLTDVFLWYHACNLVASEKGNTLLTQLTQYRRNRLFLQSIYDLGFSPWVSSEILIK